jgi:hypothetical protein
VGAIPENKTDLPFCVFRLTPLFAAVQWKGISLDLGGAPEMAPPVDGDIKHLHRIRIFLKKSSKNRRAEPCLPKGANMAINQKYTIMCDDVRQENNGKFLIVGMYVGGITVPQLPFTLPSLTFFSWLEIDRLASYTLRAKVENTETGRTLAQAIIMIDIRTPPTMPAPALVMPRFGNVQFDRAGAYSFSLTVDGQVEPTVLMPFDVVLVIPPQPQQAGQQQRP